MSSEFITVPMTNKGYESIVAEHKERTTKIRQDIIVSISTARAHGDLSENAEYDEAKNAQGLNEKRIFELEDLISRAQVIDVTSISGKQVKFGATVTVIDGDTDSKIDFILVGPVETDPSRNMVSINSPIAKALMGKSVGDSVEVITPVKEKYYIIDKIQFVDIGS